MAPPNFSGQGLYMICPKPDPSKMVTSQSGTTGTRFYPITVQSYGSPEPNQSVWIVSDNMQTEGGQYNIISPRNGGFLNANSGAGGLQLQSSSPLPSDPRKVASYGWDIVDTGDGDNSYYVNGQGNYQWNISGGKVYDGAQVIPYEKDYVEWAKFYFFPTGNENRPFPSGA